ncbi:stage II sporulation protein P [bacterium 1XD21-13]|nr:stage II sporulation protein P [bacterium 1XD21-13]
MAGDREPSYSLEEFLIKKAAGIFPLYSYLDEKELYETEIESQAAYDILVEGGAHDENEIDERTGEAFDLAERMEEENLQAAHDRDQELKEIQAGEILGAQYTMEQLADFDFLKNNFYIVENNTDISGDVLNAEKLLSKDMTIQGDASKPQILIYHTHSQEGFVDSVAGDNSTTIVGVGEYLTELLQDVYGYHVIHNTNVYDFIDGKLDRNRAYALAEEEVQQILAENPSIEVIIDLHRDGVKEGTHLVTEVNGKPTAQFMFFNGLSYSKRNGVIDYLPNPYIEDNLALSLQLKLASETYYPGLSRRIYLKSLRYNLHLRPKCLLVEAGAQTNTLEEMMNAMEPLAYVLHEVLGGGEVIEE